MDWREAIVEPPADLDVAEGVTEALERLLEEDLELLQADANERAITACLGCYLRLQFVEWDVDCEYNRDGHRIKTLFAANVVPDIIVHRRGTKDNLLVIEAKKTNSSGADCDDLEKLKQFLSQLHYRHALFLKFSVPPHRVGVAEVKWVRNSAV